MGSRGTQRHALTSGVTEDLTGRVKRFRPKVGKVYRTEDLAGWTPNPTRMVQRMVQSGELVRLKKGLYLKPERNRYGEMPPSATEVVRAFVKDSPYVFTGPEYWNALGLGSTAVFPVQPVYNTKRSGEYQLGGRRFRLSRQRFPRRPTPEWFAVDLIEHRALVGVDEDTLKRGLTRAVTAGTLSADRLATMAKKFGTKHTQEMVADALGALQGGAPSTP